ncbi:MAG: tyrosine-protein phosphatase [Acidobacteriota bacterium]
MKRLLLLAVLAVLSVAAQAIAQNACTVPRPRRIPGINNFAEVTPELYRGAAPQDAEAFRELAERGVKIDVELETGGKQAQRESQWASAAGIRYIHLPWFPWPFFSQPRKRVVAAFLKILADNPGKTVFVHCRQGSDRTGVVIAAYEIEIAHCPRKMAVQELHRFGYHRYLFPLWESWIRHLKVGPPGRSRPQSSWDSRHSSSPWS